MKIQHKLSAFKHRLKDSFEPEGRKSYSQFGEDIIIETIFYLLRKKSIKYLDIGANFPKHFSNTFYFYKKGHTGVCVEPDIELYDYYKKIRKKDLVYNIGIGSNELDEEAEFFFYSGERKGLNTFSKARVNENQALNPAKAKKRMVLLRNINRVIEENFTSKPDLLTIDIEGLDLDVLSTLDFAKNGATVICCELTKSGNNNEMVENKALTQLLLANGYFQYAHTFVNGIFVRNEYEETIRKLNNWY